VVMMTFASATMNWNHGTDGPSRYVVWMLPLVFHSVVSMRLPPGGGWRTAYGLILAASVLTQAGIIVALGGHTPRFSYLEHSPLARLLLRRVPALYNPSPEIFFERTRHREEPSPFGVFLDKDRCRKALVAVRDLGLLEAICAGLPDSVKHRRHVMPLDALMYVDFPKRMPVASAAARHAAMNPSSLAAWLALVKDRCTTPHEPPCDSVRLHVTARRVQPGDRLRADVSLGSVAIVGGVELHVGVVLHNGDHLVRGPDGVMRASGARHGLIRAERSAVVGDAGYSARVFDVEIGPEFAAGVYEVFAILVDAKPLRESELGVDLRDVVAWALETVVVTGRPDELGRNCPTDAASIPEIRAGVDRPVPDQDFVVEVRTGGAARIAREPELGPARDFLTQRDRDLRQVTVDRAQVFAVVDGHAEPVLGVRSRERHRPRRGGLHRCATLGPDVDAAVELAALRPGRPAPTELGVDSTAYRPPRRQRGQRLARTGDQALQGAEVLALVANGVGETIDLLGGGDAGLRVMGRRGAGAADTGTAPPRGGVRSKGLPDAGMQITPAPYLRLHLGHSPLQARDPGALSLDHLEQAPDFPHLGATQPPVSRDRGEAGDEHEEAGEDDDQQPAREAESQDAGTIAAHEDQAEAVATIQTGGSLRGRDSSPVRRF